MPLTFWGTKGTIVGVVKNFHFNSMHEAIRPVVLRLVGNNGSPEWVVVRVEAGTTTAAIQGLERICHELIPSFPFAYQFSDEQYNKLLLAKWSLRNYQTPLPRWQSLSPA